MTAPRSAVTEAGCRVVHVEELDDGLPLDLATITGTIAEALRPVPVGARLDTEALELTAGLLVGHVQLVLPLAAFAHRRRRPDARKPGLVGYGLAYMRNRMKYKPPSPQTHPQDALAWCQETARGLQQLLGVALADDRERQHAAAR
ncbi:hypothetical protein [Streptomyces sp. NPDC051173]|uniref:hypothetical protein n=1 Tax=Streptomyces sp. NPDC051173 TaxID=3155164 RepID=UPI00344E2BDB